VVVGAENNFDEETSSGSASTSHVIKNHGRDLGLEDFKSLACCEIVRECRQRRTGAGFLQIAIPAISTLVRAILSEICLESHHTTSTLNPKLG
jgi:hypothetical protein